VTKAQTLSGNGCAEDGFCGTEVLH
jgi:hypothetical protein